MLNRDYGCEIDEDELDQELEELDDEMFLEQMQGNKDEQPSYLQEV